MLRAICSRLEQLGVRFGRGEFAAFDAVRREAEVRVRTAAGAGTVGVAPTRNYT
jgi:hypothetical protein